MTARTKILLVTLFIVIVVAGGVLQMRSRQKEETGIIPPPPQEVTGQAKTSTMKLTFPATGAKVGQPFEVILTYSTTDTAIAAFDAVVSYDPNVLRADEIRVGTVFQTYPRKLIDPEKKRLIVTGVQTDIEQSLASTSGELTTFTITPLKSGTTKLEFVVDGDKYTNMMNKTPENVLGKTEGVEIQIE